MGCTKVIKNNVMKNVNQNKIQHMEQVCRIILEQDEQVIRRAKLACLKAFKFKSYFKLKKLTPPENIFSYTCLFKHMSRKKNLTIQDHVRLDKLYKKFLQESERIMQQFHSPMLKELENAPSPVEKLKNWCKNVRRSRKDWLD